MRLEHPTRSDWESPSVIDDRQAFEILSQPFYYLDRGAQCYVFASLDGNYVLKMFRYDRSLVKKTKGSLQEKIDHLFAACVLAQSYAQEETGLLFLHLNCSQNAWPVLQAKGPLGQSLRIPLDRYRFAIQTRVKPFQDSLLGAYEKGDEIMMRKQIDSFVNLIKSRSDKGIFNSDPSLNRNFGFLEGRAFELDFGNYSLGGASQEWEFSYYTHRLRSWLAENAPEWVAYLDKKVNDV